MNPLFFKGLNIWIPIIIPITGLIGDLVQKSAYAGWCSLSRGLSGVPCYFARWYGSEFGAAWVALRVWV